MRHEKIYKREDGTQYRVSINFYTASYGSDKASYSLDVVYKEKGKRKWKTLPDTLHDYQYRKLDMNERQKHKDKNAFRFVTKKEVYDVKIELWNKLKPLL